MFTSCSSFGGLFIFFFMGGRGVGAGGWWSPLEVDWKIPYVGMMTIGQVFPLEVRWFSELA
jgi:hypothetical protein